MELKELWKNIFLFLCMWNQKFSAVAISVPKFCSTSLCAWRVIGSFKQEVCTISICFTVQLNLKDLQNDLFFQWFWILWGLELSRSSHSGAKNFFSSSLYACGVFGSFDEKICISRYDPQLNWNWKAYKGNSFFQLF